MHKTYFILWRNTPMKMLEQALRHHYLLLTDEAIQTHPNVNEDDTWRMVGSSRLDEKKIADIVQVAENLLVDFKEGGLAQADDTLDKYLIITDTVPEWWKEAQYETD